MIYEINGTTNNDFATLFIPDVKSYTDYDPFGMLVPERFGQSVDYRYGFQGQEEDNEIKGEGNSDNFKYRMHDPRAGRFFAVDPLEKKFPFYSPYQFCSNSPILAVELEGLESSTLLNETEKGKFKKEHGSVKTWLGLRTMDILEGFINVGRLTEAKPILKYPLIQTSSEENLGSIKSLYNTTFEVMSIWQVAKYGIGGDDDEIAFKFSIKSFPKQKTLSITEIRMNLAKDFFSKFRLAEIEKHIEAINFEKPVYTQILEAGAKLYRYSKKGATDSKHYFFKEEYTLPGAVGKVNAMNNPQNYVIEEYTLTKPVKVLNSTTDLAGKAGGNQVFSVEVEKSSNIRTANTWDELLTE